MQRTTRIKSHEDLEVYQLAFGLAMRVFELSKGFPREETYTLTDQIRRASRSVCANIAEGWRKRRYPLEADLGREVEQEAGERDTRYPRVTLQEILRADPEMILLPDEPFAFVDAHRQEPAQLLQDCTAVREGRVYAFGGLLITWH